MNIPKKDIKVDPATMKAEIDAMDTGKVYIVGSDGKITQYPLPAFGTMEIASQNYKWSRPKYHITAD